MTSVSPTPSVSTRSRWMLSLVLALLLHVGVLVGLDLVPWLEPSFVEASAPEPIELVFSPETDPASETDDPDYFTELPEDRADVAPDRADALSNVDSRARDRAEGGQDEGLPQLQGEGESPEVALEPLQARVVPLSEATETPSPEDGRGQEEAVPEGETRPVEETGDPPPLDVARQDPFEELVRRTFEREGEAEILLEVKGNSDIYQEEMKNPVGNVALFGDITLNTVAWAYAPWLQRFRRDFVRNWSAPYAYYPLGLIHGYSLVELEISPDGKLLRLDLLEEEGHESLAESSIASMRATAPFASLPKDFPEPTLILRVKLIYPALRR